MTASSINENRWRAQRYGMSEGLIDFGRGALVPYPQLLEELLALVRSDAEALGCLAEVEAARGIVDAAPAPTARKRSTTPGATRAQTRPRRSRRSSRRSRRRRWVKRIASSEVVGPRSGQLLFAIRHSLSYCPISALYR